MVEFPHAVVGAAIATAIPNPLISLPLAFVSHFVLDLIPHWNPHIYTEIKKHGKILPKTLVVIVVDSVLALAVGFWIATLALPDTNHAVTILFGALFAVIPDLAEIPYYFFRVKNKFFVRLVELEHKFQTNTSFIPGVLSQVMVVAATLWWIL